MTPQTRSFTAGDGATIGYRRYGEGPPLVLVHGGATDSRCFDPLLPHLGDYSVVAYDRRGHGHNRSAPLPSLPRHAQDVAELVRAVAGDEGAFVLGYSYGALAVLVSMAEVVLPIRAAVLYEPPMGVAGMFDNTDEILGLLAAGRPDDALQAFVTSTFHLDERIVDVMRSNPLWEVSLGVVDMLAVEIPEVRDASIPSSVTDAPPARILVAEQGGNPAFVQVAQGLAGVLPGSDVLRVAGVPHFAIASNPAGFAAAVREHFARYGGPPA